MLSVAEILIRLVCETLRWLRLAVRSNRSIKAENLFLRLWSANNRRAAIGQSIAETVWDRYGMILRC
jgi:hypothetical protein